MTAAQRHDDLAEFYRIMDCLPRRAFSKYKEYKFPEKGIYFFYEDGEKRADGKHRVVRVGTHGVSGTSQTTLEERMRNHFGNAKSMGGNHRGSIMREIIGDAMIKRGESLCAECWGLGGGSRPKDQTPQDRAREEWLEEKVSEYVRAMPFSVVAVPGESKKDNMRAYIEKNSIALLSNFHCQDSPENSPSRKWLGRFCVRKKKNGDANDNVPRSGLWNNDHVDEDYDSAFLPELNNLAKKTILEYPKWEAA